METVVPGLRLVPVNVAAPAAREPRTWLSGSGPGPLISSLSLRNCFHQLPERFWQRAGEMLFGRL